MNFELFIKLNPKVLIMERSTAVAGRFYEKNPVELKAELHNFFNKAIESRFKRPQALITPHGGFAFSAKIAASAYNQISPLESFTNVFLIGSSHHFNFEGAAVFTGEKFLMPLGDVEVNYSLAKKIIKDHPQLFTDKPESHIPEHCLEVQLPFLQYHLKNSFKIIPILLGTQSPRICKSIADALIPYFYDSNLFVITTDFSHYPEYADAQRIDAITEIAILSGNPDLLITTLKANSQKGIHNLKASMCSWNAVLTLMYLAQSNPNLRFVSIDSANSGDEPNWGELSRVIGYRAIVLTDEIIK